MRERRVGDPERSSESFSIHVRQIEKNMDRNMPHFCCSRARLFDHFPCSRARLFDHFPVSFCLGVCLLPLQALTACTAYLLTNDARDCLAPKQARGRRDLRGRCRDEVKEQVGRGSSGSIRVLLFDDDGYVQLRAPVWPANKRVAGCADAPGLRRYPVSNAYAGFACRRSSWCWWWSVCCCRWRGLGLGGEGVAA